METSPFLLPDLQTLTAVLTSVLNGKRCKGGQVIVLDRQKNIYASSARSEIVMCRLPDGTELRLFCKYEVREKLAWSDVAYEAKVYRHVLEASAATTPRFYGAYTEASTGKTWLILEHLDNTVFMNGTTAQMCLAARWLGQFHAANEVCLEGPPLQFLKVYDVEYYLERVRRTLRYAGDLHEGLVWLPTLCLRFEEFARPLLAKRRTVTHGDFYWNNVLLLNGTVYVIDWEMAGIDQGEMDLARLTVGWLVETERKCELEYQKARWPGGAPADFERTMDAARLCLYFCTLGAQPDWPTNEGFLWYSKRLRSLGERLGLT